MNKKELIKQNKLLSFFIQHISSICVQHLNGIIKSSGNPNIISLEHFTLSINLQSFIDYYAQSYGQELEMEELKMDDEFKAKWIEHFDKTVNPQYQKAVEIRAKMLGLSKDGNKKEKIIEGVGYT